MWYVSLNITIHEVQKNSFEQFYSKWITNNSSHPWIILLFISRIRFETVIALVKLHKCGAFNETILWHWKYDDCISALVSIRKFDRKTLKKIWFNHQIYRTSKCLIASYIKNSDVNKLNLWNFHCIPIFTLSNCNNYNSFGWLFCFSWSASIPLFSRYSNEFLLSIHRYGQTFDKRRITQ